MIRTPGLAAALMGVLPLGGCSVIVDASGVAVRCASDEGCPSGQRCVDGVCEDRGAGPCVPEGDEICDGRDNDCDEEIDEGHDLDGDGATWCGGGVQENRDCDDNDPRRRPGQPEVCDGADNDCDQSVDEDTCPPEQACNAFLQMCEDFDCRVHGCPLEEGGCDVATGRCDAPDCRDDGPACTEIFEVCDPFSGRCVNRQGALGSPCSSHAECASVFCLDPVVARLDLPRSVCSRLCCTTEDCPEGFACWESGSGTTACVAMDVVAPGGTGELGAACSRPSDCASALCGNGRCAKPCCTNRDCDVGSCGMVQATGRPDDFVLGCLTAAGGPFGEVCIDNRDCDTRLCLDALCTRGCCASQQCGDGWICTYATTGTEDHFRVCANREDGWGGGIGEGEVGDRCVDGQDCRSTVCLAGACSDACCSDTDCPRGFACRPGTVRDGFASTCEPV